MKVLRVIPSINPAAGGPVTGLLASSKELLKSGYRIDVVSLDFPEDEVCKNFNLPLFALGNTRKVYGYSKDLSNWLSKNIANYDVVIIHGIWQYHALASSKACSEYGVPYVVFTHGMMDPWFKKTYPIKHIKKLVYWFLFLRKIISRAGAVVFTTDEERILASQSFPFYKSKECIINYGVADQISDINHQKEVFFMTYPNLKNKKFFLFLSRIHPKKGVDILIESFANCVKSGDISMLVIAGPDEVGMQNDLVRLAEQLGVRDKVIFTGILQGDEKWGAFAAADCFVLSSHQENFGIAVAEALSTSLPVLITDKVNIFREIVQDKAGFSGENSVKGFTAIMQQWCSLTEQEKNAMRGNARQCFLNRFEIKKAAKSLEQVLIDAVS